MAYKYLLKIFFEFERQKYCKKINIWYKEIKFWYFDNYIINICITVYGNISIHIMALHDLY